MVARPRQARWYTLRMPRLTMPWAAVLALSMGIAGCKDTESTVAPDTGIDAAAEAGDASSEAGGDVRPEAAEAASDAATSEVSASDTSDSAVDGFDASPSSEPLTRQFGTTVTDVAHGLAVDGSGNIVVTGEVGYGLPGQPWAGDYDAFVRKFDSTGKESWTRQFGTTGSDLCKSVAVDSSGNVIVAGSTAGTLPGQTRTGDRDAFVRKYDTSGKELWTRQFGTGKVGILLALTGAYRVAVDGSGNIFVAGDTNGTLPGQTTGGGPDGFVRKYDPSGIEVWTRQLGTIYEDIANGLALDPSGNVLVVGPTFVRKLDSTGKDVWAKAIGAGTVDAMHPYGVATDSAGRIYVTGVASSEAALRKYDPSGAEVWTVLFGGAPPTSSFAVNAAFDVSVDSWGDIIVAGMTNGILPGQATAGSRDAFVWKFDGAGKDLWKRQFGSVSTPLDDDYAYAVTTDSLGSVLVAGQTGGALPGQVSAGGTDVFVMRLPR